MPGTFRQILTRRDVLRVGAGAFGLSLPRLLHARSVEEQVGHQQARADSIIILYLSGGPSQLDMWDMKPRASEEVRGTFKPISTNVAGMQICEHMPRMARLADKYTIIRSMSHDETDHLRAGYWVMTGGRLQRPVGAFSGMARGDRPHMGGIVAKSRPAHDMPAFVVVPEFVSPREIPRPGQHAGFLGPRFDPYVINSDPNHDQYDPGPVKSLGHISAQRILGRKSLLQTLDQASLLGRRVATSDVDAYREMAFDLVSSSRAQKAFNISHETVATRQRYGGHIFSQSALVARRLVEAGVRVVQVNFPRHDNGLLGQGYDSHSVPPSPPHLTWAKDQLIPPTDAAFAALVEDLSERGLLDETLVVMMGEFGRTPRFNRNGGRDHWPNCYSIVVAGGGTAGGHVYGESDSTAATPTSDPVSPTDLLATIYHQMGIQHQATMYDMEGRPHVIVEGKPVTGLLA